MMPREAKLVSKKLKNNSQQCKDSEDSVCVCVGAPVPHRARLMSAVLVCVREAAGALAACPGGYLMTVAVI